MCGICGYLSFDKNQSVPDRVSFEYMCRTLSHRGPDDWGIYLKENIGLGNRRLSIIDLVTGHQPIHNEDKSLWIVLNGEIYNQPAPKQYLLNLSYINSSILDTPSGYACQYWIPRHYLNLYRFIQWDEEKIVSTLIDEYDWEIARDTKTTWRIGDGTAAFYNYIYYTVAGFTENDTLRSNQIREGIISKEEALKRVREENKPRFESIQWYCRTIGIDFENTLKIINVIPKLYKNYRDHTDQIRR